MKKNDLTDMKALDVKSLKGRAKNLKDELSQMVLDKNMNSLKDTKSISKKRKDLAQIMTIIKQKEYLALFENNDNKNKEVVTK